jgi:hypothetical protein
METNIQKSNTHSKETFSTGFLGNYFANSMLVTKKTKKMKTPKDKNPLGENLTKESNLILTNGAIEIGIFILPISIFSEVSRICNNSFCCSRKIKILSFVRFSPKGFLSFGVL